MLREGTTWMAIPASFNDPFDCKPSILRNTETEQRDLKQINKNRLREIKRALKTGRALLGRDLQQIPHRTLVNLRRLLDCRTQRR